MSVLELFQHYLQTTQSLRCFRSSEFIRRFTVLQAGNLSLAQGSRLLPLVICLFFTIAKYDCSAQATQEAPPVQASQETPVVQPNTEAPAVEEKNERQAQEIATDIQKKAAAIQKSIEDPCKYKPNETNLKNIRRTNACINNAIRIHQQTVRLNESLRRASQAEAVMQERKILTPQQVPRNILRDIQQPAEDAASQPSGTGSAQAFVGGSLVGTPTTCGAGSGFNNPALIRVHRVVMAPQVASDDFGYRLGRTYLVYQVTVENGSKDFQFMLQDVSIDFSHQFGQPPGTYSYSASGQDLTLLRGVPEKGQDRDPRNLVLHVLQGIGSVAGAVSGLTAFSDVMGPSVANFNGAFLQAYTTISPDHTGTQLNRLSDSAFMANAVIDKQRARTLAMFIPADEVLSHAEQKDFRKDPNAFLGFGGSSVLNSADVCVDGTFIQAVTIAAPTLASAVLAKAPAPAANLDTVLTVTGSNLVSGDTEAVISSASSPSTGLIVTTDGKTGTAQVHLPSDYATGTTTAMLRSKTNPSLTSGAGLKITVAP
jgi:hypothetical protein